MLALAVAVGLAGAIPDVTTNRTQAGEVAAAIATYGQAGRHRGLLPRSAGPGRQPAPPRGPLPADHLPPGHRPRVRQLGRLRRRGQGRPRPRPSPSTSSRWPAAGRQIFLVWAGGYQGFGLKCEGIVQTLQDDPHYQVAAAGGGERRQVLSTHVDGALHTDPALSRPYVRTRIPNRRRRAGGGTRPGSTVTGARKVERPADRAGDTAGEANRDGAPGTGANPDQRPGPHVGRAVVEVLPAWVAARVLVALSLVLAHLLVNGVRPSNPGARLRVHQGLLAWDGGWYEAIAGHGYAAAGSPVGPVLPGLSRWRPGCSVGSRGSASGPP